MSKDYSLLRPFDLEKAKQGEPILTYLGSTCTFVGPLSNSVIAIEDPTELGKAYSYASTSLRMAPLFWLEDKPVYKGDILYRKLPGTNEIQELTVQSIENCTEDPFIRFEQENQAEYVDNRRQCLYWNKPKQKKQGWINVYPNDDNQRTCLHTYTTKEFADQYANKKTRIACIPFEYEVD